MILVYAFGVVSSFFRIKVLRLHFYSSVSSLFFL
jgi:hypothetical protein